MRENLSKFFPIGISAIVLCATIQVFSTIKKHNSMLTALPLRTRVFLVVSLWAVILLAFIAIYLFVKNGLKK